MHHEESEGTNVSSGICQSDGSGLFNRDSLAQVGPCAGSGFKSNGAQNERLGDTAHGAENGQAQGWAEKAKGIEPRALPCLHLTERNLMRAISAVYFLFNRHDRIIYIGQTGNLKRRWYNHEVFHYLDVETIELKRGYRVAFLETEEKSVRINLERELIKLHRPEFNDSHNNKNTPAVSLVTEQEATVSVTDAAAVLGVGRSRVLALINAGRLPAVKVSTIWTIREKDLEKVKVRKPGRPPKTKPPAKPARKP